MTEQENKLMDEVKAWSALAGSRRERIQKLEADLVKTAADYRTLHKRSHAVDKENDTMSIRISELVEENLQFNIENDELQQHAQEQESEINELKYRLDEFKQQEHEEGKADQPMPGQEEGN